MTRMSKQGKRRNQSPRRPKLAGVKTGPKKDNLANGYKEHANALEGNTVSAVFVGKIR